MEIIQDKQFVDSSPLSWFEFYVQYGAMDNQVNLLTKICTRKVFDLTGLPCVHALVAAHELRIDSYTLCSRLEF